MAMLTGPEIARQVLLGGVVIDPFDPARCGPNSYDALLAADYRVYVGGRVLDVAADNPTELLRMPATGLLLEPGQLYLASTAEVIGSKSFVSCVEGKSSLGRLGLTVHVTAGFIDCGFFGNVTLELAVVKPLRVYPGMRVCQFCFFTVQGEVSHYAGKYQGQRGPQPSRSWQDFQNVKGGD